MLRLDLLFDSGVLPPAFTDLIDAGLDVLSPSELSSLNKVPECEIDLGDVITIEVLGGVFPGHVGQSLRSHTPEVNSVDCAVHNDIELRDDARSHRSVESELRVGDRMTLAVLGGLNGDLLLRGKDLAQLGSNGAIGNSANSPDPVFVADFSSFDLDRLEWANRLKDGPGHKAAVKRWDQGTSVVETSNLAWVSPKTRITESHSIWTLFGEDAIVEGTRGQNLPSSRDIELDRRANGERADLLHILRPIDAVNVLHLLPAFDLEEVGVNVSAGQYVRGQVAVESPGVRLVVRGPILVCFRIQVIVLSAVRIAEVPLEAVAVPEVAPGKATEIRVLGDVAKDLEELLLLEQGDLVAEQKEPSVGWVYRLDPLELADIVDGDQLDETRLGAVREDEARERLVLVDVAHLFRLGLFDLLEASFTPRPDGGVGSLDERSGDVDRRHLGPDRHHIDGEGGIEVSLTAAPRADEIDNLLAVNQAGLLEGIRHSDEPGRDFNLWCGELRVFAEVVRPGVPVGRL